MAIRRNPDGTTTVGILRVKEEPPVKVAPPAEAKAEAKPKATPKTAAKKPAKKKD